MLLRYKGEVAYGTVLGGVCSFIATLFFAVFKCAQLWSWATAPSYNQSEAVTFLDYLTYEPFEVSTSEFIPAIQIQTVPKSE